LRCQQGSGGLEVHTLSDTDPFDTVKGEMIDVDAVFLKKYPKDWFDLYIGCGGEHCPPLHTAACATLDLQLALFTLHSNHALQVVYPVSILS
tara:strand:- start:42 stop:317 length:276 start_codon:yes stop_codon:yes gene_type:complete